MGGCWKHRIRLATGAGSTHSLVILWESTSYPYSLSALYLFREALFLGDLGHFHLATYTPSHITVRSRMRGYNRIAPTLRMLLQVTHSPVLPFICLAKLNSRVSMACNLLPGMPSGSQKSRPTFPSDCSSPTGVGAVQALRRRPWVSSIRGVTPLAVADTLHRQSREA